MYKISTKVYNMFMKKISTKKALEIAYSNLYSSDIKHIDRNLDNLLKAKKVASIENGLKTKQDEDELEK